MVSASHLANAARKSPGTEACLAAKNRLYKELVFFVPLSFALDVSWMCHLESSGELKETIDRCVEQAGDMEKARPSALQQKFEKLWPKNRQFEG